MLFKFKDFHRKFTLLGSELALQSQPIRYKAQNVKHFSEHHLAVKDQSLCYLHVGIHNIVHLIVQFPKCHLSLILEILYIDYGIKLKLIYISFSEIRGEWQFSLMKSIPVKVTQKDLSQRRAELYGEDLLLKMVASVLLVPGELYTRVKLLK